jgi:hypothetical protein
VPFQVIDRQQRPVGGEGQPFGGIHPHQQTACQPRPVRHGDGVQCARRHARLRQRLCDHRLNRQHVLPAGDFGKDAAEAPVQLDLRGDDIGVHHAPILHHRRRRLVTACFNRKNFHTRSIRQIRRRGDRETRGLHISHFTIQA